MHESKWLDYVAEIDIYLVGKLSDKSAAMFLRLVNYGSGEYVQPLVIKESLLNSEVVHILLNTGKEAPLIRATNNHLVEYSSSSAINIPRDVAKI